MGQLCTTPRTKMPPWGAGMVHPNVLAGVGYDPAEYTGFAFGLGIERTVSWICGLSHVRETIPFPRMLNRLAP